MIASRFSSMVCCGLGLMCTSLGPARAQDQAALIAAQCKVMVRAYNDAVKAKADYAGRIVAGCPGYANVAPQGLFANNAAIAAFGTATSSDVPKVASQHGEGGDRFYKVMLARGVPPAAATALAGSADFATAAKMWTKMLGK